jgi:hypothetical protein
LNKTFETEIIDKAIKQARQNGYLIKPYQLMMGNRVCPMGAVLTWGEPELLHPEWMKGFMNGYDGTSPYSKTGNYAGGYATGKVYRKRYP